STRGVHPRFNCAARKPDNTANSNALMPVGRRIMAASVASATLTHSKAFVRTLAGMAEDSESRQSVYWRSVICCYLLSDSRASDLPHQIRISRLSCVPSPSILPGPPSEETCIHAMQE